MKEGDICALDSKPGWFLWCKHKIKSGVHPMSLANGGWIIGVYHGDTPMQSLLNGEVFASVVYIRRSDKCTKVGHLKVDSRDVVYPQFYECRAENGEETFYLCEGYETIRKVDSEQRVADAPFSSQGIGGIEYAIDNKSFEQERADFRLDHRYEIR